MVNNDSLKMMDHTNPPNPTVDIGAATVGVVAVLFNPVAESFLRSVVSALVPVLFSCLVYLARYILTRKQRSVTYLQQRNAALETENQYLKERLQEIDPESEPPRRRPKTRARRGGGNQPGGTDGA
jgi:Tfp pilus assembly protein PilN